jgi:hypothetical protein
MSLCRGGANLYIDETNFSSKIVALLKPKNGHLDGKIEKD